MMGNLLNIFLAVLLLHIRNILGSNSVIDSTYEGCWPYYSLVIRGQTTKISGDLTSLQACKDECLTNGYPLFILSTEAPIRVCDCASFVSSPTNRIESFCTDETYLKNGNSDGIYAVYSINGNGVLTGESSTNGVPQSETSTDRTTQSETTTNVEFQSGTTTDGASQSGTTTDGASQSVTTTDGASQSGTTTDGAFQSGTTTNGASPSGTTTDGASQSGTTTNGASQSGTTTDGASQSGTTTNGESQSGTTTNGRALVVSSQNETSQCQYCDCPTQEITYLTFEDLTPEQQRQINEIKNKLTLDKKKLSSYIRTKTSASDDRPTAKGIGSIGLVILILCLGVIVVMDSDKIITGSKKVYDIIKYRKHKFDREQFDTKVFSLTDQNQKNTTEN